MADRPLTDREVVEEYMRAAREVRSAQTVVTRHRDRIIQLLATHGAVSDFGSVLLMIDDEPEVVATISTYSLDKEVEELLTAQETGETKVA